MYRVNSQTGQGFKAHDRQYSQCAALGPAACTCVRARMEVRGRADMNSTHSNKAHSSTTDTNASVMLLPAPALRKPWGVMQRYARWYLRGGRRAGTRCAPGWCIAVRGTPDAGSVQDRRSDASLSGPALALQLPPGAATAAGSGSRRLQVGVAIQLALVKALERLALGERHAAIADGALAVAGERRIQLGHVVLHVLEHLVGGVALDDLLDPPAALVVQAHVYHVRVAEQVVQIAERLLISPDQEGRQVIFLARPELVQLEGALHIAQRHEMIDLAVGVAGDVGENRGARRPLFQAVDRHDGEQLVDRPAVGQ